MSDKKRYIGLIRVLPFPLQWAARQRVSRGLPVYAFNITFSDRGTSSGWQASIPPPAPDALSQAYALLSLTPSATEDEVRSAYRRAAFEHHPDRGGDVKMFHAVSEAKDRLLAHIKTR